MRIPVLALVATCAWVACKSDDQPRRAVGAPPPPSAPATPPPAAVDPGTGLAAGAGSAVGTRATCIPVSPHQRPGKATITVVGDGVEQRMTDGPAVCGALHTVATKRFAIGDGTLYRACLPDGSSFAISADVALAGKVDPTFVYADYKKTGPLLEYTRPGVGTYNQRDPIGDGDALTITPERDGATATITLVWPSKADRQVAVTATFVCDPPVP